MNISTVCIIGAGNLGTRIALQAAISGFKVTLYDLNQEFLDRSFLQIEKLSRQLIRNNYLDEKNLPELFTKLHFTSTLKDALLDADFVSENVTEDLEIKKVIWGEISKIVSNQTILTTNTSYLLPSQFATLSGHPENFCSFHFHDVFYSRVVDIMPHEGTDSEVIKILEWFGRKLNQVPILVKKEHSGYIFNTLLISWIDAAGRLLTGEIAEIEAIDKSWMINFKMESGPFGVLDGVGLDTAWHITNSRRSPASKAFATLLKTYVDQGKLGVKSGEGFYSYPNPAYRQADFLT
jgi:3-hydroxybutyryl-CoA dehydrogenase